VPKSGVLLVVVSTSLKVNPVYLLLVHESTRILLVIADDIIIIIGHLGDVFNDGWIFPGTPAYDSGTRFCVDGAALVFRPVQGEEVMGDLYPKQRKV